MIKLRDKYHLNCIFNSDLFSLKISFDEMGELTAHFNCNEKYQGYSGIIHGGILSGIIDSVMTLYLFGHNIIAYTVRLNIKYSHPVIIEKEAIIKVRLKEKQNDFIYNLTASIFQNKQKRVTADAKFWLKKSKA